MARSPIVMQGYVGNDDATAETIEDDGWLHTGDLASIDDDGFIFIVDRKKDMILTAGYNVYPAELERVIAAHPAVAMVAVGPCTDEDKGEIAKAYIVLKDGARAEPTEIIDLCRTELAAYKVPPTGSVLRRPPEDQHRQDHAPTTPHPRPRMTRAQSPSSSRDDDRAMARTPPPSHLSSEAQAYLA